MNKTLRALSALLIVVVLCLGTVTIAFASTSIPAATSDFYVNDFAGVFSEFEKGKLMTNAVEIANETKGIQVVVTTIKTLNGDTIENYAYNMYNQYSIGKDDMGILILLATEDRQIRIEVGRAMEGYINDAKAGRFIDKYAIPYLAENKFNEGLISLQEALIKEIRSNINSKTTTGDTSEPIDIDWLAVFGVIATILVSGLVVVLVIYVVRTIKRKSKEKQDYIDSLNRENASLKHTIEMLQTTNQGLRRENNSVDEALTSARITLEKHENWRKRILVIYPDADKKVDEMIREEKIAQDKAIARRVDEHISEIINKKPDKDLVRRLNSVKIEYDYLSFEQKKYIESDMAKFATLYNASVSLKRAYDEQVERERILKLTQQRKQKAEDITKKLLSIIALVGIASASDLSRLREAKRLYYDIDSETRSYVDCSAISKIEELLRKAKQDKDEEEARRRRAAYNSTSSYSSVNRSSFRGAGGRSGGGGASRRF